MSMQYQAKNTTFLNSESHAPFFSTPVVATRYRQNSFLYRFWQIYNDLVRKHYLGIFAMSISTNDNEQTRLNGILKSVIYSWKFIKFKCRSYYKKTEPSSIILEY